MNAHTVNNTELSALASTAEEIDPAVIVDLDRTESIRRAARNQEHLNNRVLHFFAELRRRQVCRTITMYSVALWLICQILDIVQEPLGLPDWTLKLIIVIGLIGFPIALILAWFFDITQEGVVSDKDAHVETVSRRPFDQVLDCTLVLLALVIGLQLATGILGNEVEAAGPIDRKVAVLPFSVASGDDAEALSHGLISELQHELTLMPGMTAIAGSDRFDGKVGVSLTGAVSVSTSTVRVTATLIDNDTGEVTWSERFELPVEEGVHASAELARDIVSAMAKPMTASVTTGGSHAT
jgi:adenylate cyclase